MLVQEMETLGPSTDSLGTVKEELFRGHYIDICEVRKENDSEDLLKTICETFNSGIRCTLIGGGWLKIYLDKGRHDF